MANPYFTSNPQFGRSGGGVQLGESSYASQQVGVDQFNQVEQSYYGPSATSAQTGRMTLDDVIMKSALTIGTVVLVAIGAWMLVPPAVFMPVMLTGLLVGFVLGLVNAFKKVPSPGLILGYAIAEGVFLGTISKVFGMVYSGAVMQAIVATFVTFAVCLLLYKSRLVKVNARFTRIVVLATIAYAVFCLVNLAVMFFAPGAFGEFGLRSGLLGIGIGLIAVVLASMNLMLDFEFISQGVRNGVDRRYAWSAAFGLTVTLVWLYIEFLRLAAIFAGRD